ncbi:MAG: uncharacterized protein KVP18_004679 [Porospora cf. gigantea A]|nr:MAG: hypothetical protein KVP18_004679 [Porospora cf. gigantea A]
MQLTGASQSDAGMSMLSSPAPSTCVGRVSIESLGRRELKAKPPESNGQAPTAHFGSPWSQAFSPVASITSEPHRLLNSVSPRSQRSATIHGIRRGHSRQSETRFTAAEKRQLVDILRRQQDQIDTLQNKVKRSKGCSSRGSCANLQTAWIKDSSGTGSFATAHSVSPSSMGPLYPPRSPLTQMTRTAFEKDSDERKWFNEDTPAAGTDEAWLQSFLERDRLHAPGNLLTHQSLRPGQRQVCTVEDLFRSNEPRDSCRSRDYWHRVVCCKP